MFQSRSNNDAEKVFAGVYRRLYSEPAEAVCASRDQRGAPVTTGVGYSAGTDDPMAPAAPTDSVRAIQGLSPGRLALRRLLKDRVTMVAFFVAIFFVVLALVAPLLEAAKLIDPQTPHPEPVSYTHLDVYKRQVQARRPVLQGCFRLWHTGARP